MTGGGVQWRSYYVKLAMYNRSSAMLSDYRYTCTDDDGIRWGGVRGYSGGTTTIEGPTRRFASVYESYDSTR